MQYIQPYVDVQNVEGKEEIIIPSRIHFRRPKYLIDIDNNILKSMPNKISKRTYQRKLIVCGDYFLKN